MNLKAGDYYAGPKQDTYDTTKQDYYEFGIQIKGETVYIKISQGMLNKQLFYTDFTHYKNHGVSVTGLSYRAIQYGPVPANYDNIYAYLEYEQIISSQFLKLPNGSAREVFVSDADFDKMLFSDEEKNTISAITEKFANISSWDIVELSHQEKAWKELEASKQLIKYQDYAFELTAL